jgi:hypothetical protein
MRVESLKLKVKSITLGRLTPIAARPARHSHSVLSTQYLALVFLLFLAACAQAAPTPTAQSTLVPSLTASPDVQAAVLGTLTALADVPKNTVTPAPGESAATEEATPEATPVVVTIQPFLGKNLDAPLDVTLPKGWALIKNDVLLMADIRPEGVDPNNTINGIPLLAYQGPVTGGTGTIVVLWGFPNLANPFPQNGTPTAPDLWSDGLRLLRSAVIDPKCNIGTDLKRTYRVGLESAVGTQFAAVGCPGEPDTRGWFAGLQQNRLNYVFYVYADPIAAMDTGRDELQAILDTVRFRPLPETTAAP